MSPSRTLSPSPARHSSPSGSEPHSLVRDSRHSWAVGIALALWCGFLFFYGLSTGELYRNETLRAVLAAEMLRNGDWVVPRLYGEPLLTKPPGMYIAIAMASWPFGAVT